MPDTTDLEIDVAVGGNPECVDTFTGQALTGKLTSRMLGSKTSVMVTPMSTISIGWDDLDTSNNLTTIDPMTGKLFDLSNFEPTVIDHIEALANENSRSLGAKAIGQMTKIYSLVSLGAVYINETRGVTFESASSYMYQSMVKLASDNGETYDFFTMPAPVDAIKGGLQMQQAAASRRRSLQQSDADLDALGSVMVLLFTNIEEKSSEDEDISVVVQDIAKVSITAETVVLEEVKDLAAGRVNSTAFKEANTAAKINSKVKVAAVPSTLQETFDKIVPKPEPVTPAPTQPPPPPKSDSSKDNSGMILGIVFGTLALALLIVVGVFVSARHARKRRMAEDSSLPMTIDLSSQLYTPYEKKKKSKKEKTYAPAGASSSLEMTSVGSSQAEALA